MESLSNSNKNLKRIEDEDNKLDNLDFSKALPSPKIFDEGAGIDYKEISRENLISNVNIRQSDIYRNQ